MTDDHKPTGNSTAEPSATADATCEPWLSSYPDDIDWSAEIDDVLLPELFDRAVAAHGDAPCIDFLGKRYTYAEVGALVDRAAQGLQQLGVARGSKVGLYLPNTPYYVVMYYAVLKCGATVVNYNPLYARDEVLWQIGDSGTSIMVTLDVELLWSKVAQALAEDRIEKAVLCSMTDVLRFPKSVLFPLFRRKDLAKVAPNERVVPFEKLTDNDGQPEPVELDGELEAVFQYTGGTTGTPKGAVLLHRNVAANTLQVRMLLPGYEEAAERFLGVLPLCHVFAMTSVMNLAVAMAAEMVLLPKFDLGQVLDTIASRQPTIFPGVPAIYAAINEAKRLRRYDLKSLEFCISGGAGLPVEVKRRFEKVTGCKLVEGYGLSESSPVAACNPIRGLNKEGSIGIPIPGTWLSVHSLDDPRQPVPLGEKGEICIRGPQLMAGYRNREDETAHAIIDGWLHTGDIGFMDEDGYTFIVDRIKDVIFRGGYNVYPRVIEEAIYEHPFVAECSVCGVPDDAKGEYPKAFIRLDEGANLTAEAMFEFLQDKLSRLEMPKEIEFRTDPLPKTMLGKPSKKDLRAEELERRNGAG
jgi:long-chain acyl-CoA synthetase